ncbi:hypothetical protein HD554DRAFT_2319682 [Boletus coccyginus]|nr:hypothetical protein HD554DRAFT_2319682 [Boletus coccyginus]
MGRLRRSRTHKAQRDIHRASRTRARTKDLDQIQLIDLDPKNRAALEAQPLDFEKPGLAQHYCVECAKYYETDTALLHKKRCRALREPAYTIEESERAAGLGKEGKRPSSTTSTWIPPTASTASVATAFPA